MKKPVVAIRNSSLRPVVLYLVPQNGWIVHPILRASLSLLQARAENGRRTGCKSASMSTAFDHEVRVRRKADAVQGVETACL